jgi:hypothetical protein
MSSVSLPTCITKHRQQPAGVCAVYMHCNIIINTILAAAGIQKLLLAPALLLPTHILNSDTGQMVPPLLLLLLLLPSPLLLLLFTPAA